MKLKLPGPVPSRRAISILLAAGVAIAFFVFTWLAWSVISLTDTASVSRDRYEESRKDRTDLRNLIEAMQELDAQQTKALADANARLLELGEDPVRPVPRTPAQGVRGLSCVEELGLEVCRGDKGDDGETGARGAASTIPGPAGAASTVPGPRGSTCIEELGLEACRGEKGEKGEKGDEGPAGKDAPPVDLTGYATREWVLSLIAALGCDVTIEGGIPNQIITCTINGKP